jgi:hypothetical protein
MVRIIVAIPVVLPCIRITLFLSTALNYPVFPHFGMKRSFFKSGKTFIVKASNKK